VGGNEKIMDNVIQNITPQSETFAQKAQKFLEEYRELCLKYQCSFDTVLQIVEIKENPPQK
jgi:hypothetical protein